MNTIPSTPEPDAPYTLVGHRDPAADARTPAVILLNRGSRLVRRDYIAAIVQDGFSEVISVESRENSFSVEALSREFPTVRFLLLNRDVSPGTRVNMAMRLIQAEHVLVMWSTMDPPGRLSRASDLLNRSDDLCLVPSLRNERGEALPIVQVPALQRRQLRVISLPVRGQRTVTLFPFDYVGLYHRVRFEACGMFDDEIPRGFWQKLDFGFRVAMWGETIGVEPTFRMSYRLMPDPEDQTVSRGYDRFYAKNLAVRIGEGNAHVSPLRAVPFALRARKSIPLSVRTFRDAARWVQENSARFRRDARTVVEEWNVEYG